MKISNEGIVALALHEGIVPAPYKDSKGVMTYGIGHTVKAGGINPNDLEVGMPLDVDNALKTVFTQFRQDLKRYENDCNEAIKVQVNQHEFDAAVSFHYNTGAIKGATWVKTLNRGDYIKAGTQIMNWSKPAEIVPRREAERTLFRTGKYPKGNIPVWKVDGTKVVWEAERFISPEEMIGILEPKKPKSILTLLVEILLKLYSNK